MCSSRTVLQSQDKNSHSQNNDEYDGNIDDQQMNEYITPRLDIKSQEYYFQKSPSNKQLIKNYLKKKDSGGKLRKSQLSSSQSSSSDYEKEDIIQSKTELRSNLGSYKDMNYNKKKEFIEELKQQFFDRSNNNTPQVIADEKENEQEEQDYIKNSLQQLRQKKMSNVNVSQHRRRSSQLNPDMLLQWQGRKQTFQYQSPLQQPPKHSSSYSQGSGRNTQFIFQNNLQSQHNLPALGHANSNPPVVIHEYNKSYTNMSTPLQFNKNNSQPQKIALHLVQQNNIDDISSQFGSQQNLNLNHKKDKENFRNIGETFSREVSNQLSFPQTNTGIQHLQQQLLEIEWDLLCFDKICNYKYYFPYNNYDQILNMFKKQYQKRKAKLFNKNTFLIKKKEITDNIQNRKSNQINSIKNIANDDDKNKYEDEDNVLQINKKNSQIDKYPARRASRQRYLEYQKQKRDSYQQKQFEQLENQNKIQKKVVFTQQQQEKYGTSEIIQEVQQKKEEDKKENL